MSGLNKDSFKVVGNTLQIPLAGTGIDLKKAHAALKGFPGVESTSNKPGRPGQVLVVDVEGDTSSYRQGMIEKQLARLAGPESKTDVPTPATKKTAAKSTKGTPQLPARKATTPAKKATPAAQAPSPDSSVFPTSRVEQLAQPTTETSPTMTFVNHYVKQESVLGLVQDMADNGTDEFVVVFCNTNIGTIVTMVLKPSNWAGRVTALRKEAETISGHISQIYVLSVGDHK